MNPETISARLAARLDAAASTDDVLQVLAELRGVPRTHPDAASLGALEGRAFDYVRRLTDAAPDAAALVLGTELLPRCLEHDPSRRDTPWPSYAGIFGEWLKELPSRHQADVRSVALAAASAAFNENNIPGGLRVVAQVGYADPAVCQQLEELIGAHADELGDRALGVRVSLGASPDARVELRRRLHQRLQERGTYRLFDVAKRIGDLETADLILGRWLTPLSAAESRLDDLVALDALAEVSVRVANVSAATGIWRRILEVAAAIPGEKLIRTLDMGVISRFPTPEVIPNLLDQVASSAGTGRWITYSRLDDCVHPDQLQGWETAPAHAIDVVAADAVAVVPDRGAFKTEIMRQKEHAWEVMLCVGCPDRLPSIADAVERNASGHVAHAFLELAACLGVEPLPGIVPTILAGNAPDVAWSADELLVAQVGAIRTANAAMSEQAFEALRRYRPARDGILISVIEALAKLAQSAAVSGDRSRVAALLVTLTDLPVDPTARATAGAALAKLLEAGVLKPDEGARLAEYAAAPDVDPYTRRALLYSFAARPEVDVPHPLLSLAEVIAGYTRVLTEEERKAALAPAAVMLRASRLGGDALRAFQAGQLGLVESGDRVHVTDAAAVPAVAYFLVATWYAADPVRYAPAVGTLLQTDDPRRVAPLVAAIRRVGGVNPPNVVGALVDRTRRMDAGREAEPFILDLLAEVAPAQLTVGEWARLDHWLPQARAAMAEAVGRIRDDPFRSGCERLLIRLACDGVFGVRRSAFRAFSELAPDAFVALAVGWATAGGDAGVGLRQRAAEAYRWVRPGEVLESLRVLEWDPEPTVREAFARAAGERREGGWADDYARRVLSAAVPADVVRLWRYGSALTHLGDDRTVALLRDRAQGDIPPNVRFWLDRVRKAVQGRWDDVVRKWPEPLFARHGRYEVVDALLLWGDGSQTEARTHLWFAASDQPDGFSSWGGWAELSNSSPTNAWKRAFRGTIGSGQERLVVSGRPPADILVTRQFSGDGSRVVFSGNGTYPGDAALP